MFDQKSWRKVATICLLISGCMAVYAATSDMMRDSLVHSVRLFSGEEGDLSTSNPIWACLFFWGVFAMLLFVTIYIAILDFRFIRLRFALEKQALSQQSWNDKEMSDLLAKTKTGQEESSEPDNS